MGQKLVNDFLFVYNCSLRNSRRTNEKYFFTSQRMKSVFSGATSEDSDTNPVIEVVCGENQSLTRIPCVRRSVRDFLLFLLCSQFQFLAYFLCASISKLLLALSFLYMYTIRSRCRNRLLQILRLNFKSFFLIQFRIKNLSTKFVR